MRIKQEVHCPNCGSLAARDYFTKTYLIQTECSVCDYLMINCSRTGKVIEAYAPGINPRNLLFSTSQAEQPVTSLSHLYKERCATSK